MAPILKIRDLWKKYDGVPAVAGIGFEVSAGSMVGLLGHNGAGKTTTIRIVLDIIQSDSGEVSVFGKTVDDKMRDRIGYLPEERGLYAHMAVLDFLLFMGMLRGMSMGHARKEAVQWLERLELGDRRASLINELSKGNQQKVQLIATLIHDPELLILDEPFSGLDPVNRHIFEKIVVEMRNKGKAVIFSTHVLEQAERLLDEVIMLRKGIAVVQGTMDEVRGEFGRGWLEVRGKGIDKVLSAHPSIVKSRVLNDGTMRCHLSPDLEPQQILRELVESGALIDRFDMVEPSLNDIFLERVGGIAMDSEEADMIPREASA